MFEWMAPVWVFIQFPHLKGGDGKEIKAVPTEITLGFLRSTGVDEKHLVRKPVPGMRALSHAIGKEESFSASFWPAFKSLGFMEQ